MTRGPDNLDWLARLPIDLDTLAGLVEGDLDDARADAVREQLLAADPEIAHRVEMMCQDRVMLRTLGDERPPPGLADAVIARLEREALLGLADGDTTGGPIPISRVREHRTSRWAGTGRWLASPAGAGLALAAALALAVGITLQVLPGRGSAQPKAGDLGPIAKNDTTVPERAMSSEPTADQTAIAAEVPDPPPMEIAKAEVPEPAPAELFSDDWDRALSLMAEGRLLVRVRSVEPTETEARLAGFVGRADRPGEAWRLGSEVDQPVATALETKFAPVRQAEEPRAFASDAQGPQPDIPDMHPREKRSPLEAVYLADTRADRAALASLSAALSLGDGQRAVFEELPEPLGLPSVLTPDAVLWWGRPANEWVKRGFVPVVIERVER